MTPKLSAQVGPYFGQFGGRFVPEPLIAALDELDATYQASRNASLIASFRVLDPVFTATTSAPSSFILATLSAWRSVSTSPM